MFRYFAGGVVVTVVSEWNNKSVAGASDWTTDNKRFDQFRAYKSLCWPNAKRPMKRISIMLAIENTLHTFIEHCSIGDRWYLSCWTLEVPSASPQISFTSNTFYTQGHASISEDHISDNCFSLHVWVSVSLDSIFEILKQTVEKVKVQGRRFYRFDLWREMAKWHCECVCICEQIWFTFFCLRFGWAAITRTTCCWPKGVKYKII